MKRLQFGLRMMLLLVALAATIIGWRTAVSQIQTEDRKGERRQLELTLVQLDRQIESANAMLGRPDDGHSHDMAKQEIAYVQTQITRIKKLRYDLSK